MRKLIIAFVMITLTFAVAYAATQGATTSLGATGKITETSAGNATAEGGNVTLVNLTATVSTDKWQGFYGNVTGTLSLGLGGSSFYDFSAATPLSILATTNDAFNFANLEPTTAGEIDTVWGYTTATDNDQAVDVYTQNRNISGVVSVATLLNGGAGNWYTAAFDGGAAAVKNDFAFGANYTAGAGFDGTDYDYQLMVPADAGTNEVYYFFVEI